MPVDDLDDETVANLLKQDAKAVGGRFAFPSSRPSSQAPKPNTRFLRNIIRETNNHNAALLAKEAEESKARFKGLQRDSDTGSGKRKAVQAPSIEHQSTKRKRDDRQEIDEARPDAPRRRSSRARQSARDNKEEDANHRDRAERHGHRRERRDRSNERERHRSHRAHRHDRTDKDSADEHRVRKHRSSRHDHKSTHRRRSHSGDRRRSSPSKHRRRHLSRTRSRSPDVSASTRSNRENRHRTSSPRPGSDSDPLEAIVGPIPATEPVVKSKGRGAYRQSSAMDAHFSKNYDPSADVNMNPDLEDDWDMALEALRDRQKWHQQGADRLRSVGFTESEIQKWEKGGEKNECDVRWAKRGEGREWDRGKVVDDAGEIDTKAEWGRLKGT